MSAKTNLKLAKLWLDRKEYTRLTKVGSSYLGIHFNQRDQKLLRDLTNATAANESDDQSQKGTQLLEIYALEIQMYNETRNFKKLKVNFTP